ncbi:MAG: oxidoreductase [Pararhodobacter sp.]|nr:oxidoreductase [Pararhodobacter sp.]
MELRVSAAAPAAERVRELVLEPVAGSLPSYAPGAHVEITLPDGDTRPYSLIDLEGRTSAPAHYRLGVLLEAESKGGSRYMHALSVGDRVTASAPKNDFALADSEAPALLIAGGIGVTPIISMAGALKAVGRPYRLVYAAQDAGRMAFREALEAEHGEALALHFDDRAGGPLPLKPLIESAAPGAHLYVCGPRAMIEAARAAAEAAGFAPERIHFELFEKAAPQADDQPFEVELASSGQVFTIPPGRSIIEVLEESGIDLMYDCQRGDCGICQTDVLEGEPDHRDVVLSQAERDSGKVMQICVSRAKSARLKLDL